MTGAFIHPFDDDRFMAGVREPETASPSAASLANGRASTFEGWQRSFVGGAGGRSVLPSMWPLLSRLTSGSIAAAGAVAAAMSGRAMGKVVAIVSGGDIEVPAFATLVGASKEK
jgi:threonine dehydratase